jgi:hypothetical protein
MGTGSSEFEKVGQKSEKRLRRENLIELKMELKY